MKDKLIFLLFIFLLLFSCTNSEENKAIELMNKGNDFMENKNYSSALFQFKDVNKLSISNNLKTINYRNMVVCFLYLNEVDSAKTYSLLGKKLAEEKSYYYYIHDAESNLLSNKIEKAIKLLEKAKSVSKAEGIKEITEINNNLSLIYSGNYGDHFIDLEKALFYAKEAYQSNKSEIHLEQLASVYFQKENYQKAKELFLELKTKHPEVVLYQFYLGQTIYFLSDTKKGIEMMKNAADKDETCKELFEQITS